MIYGTSSGLMDRDDLWHQDNDGLAVNAARGDDFGAAVGAGDFDADGYPDLVAGVPGQGIGSSNEAGAVAVLYGSDGGVTTRDQLWHRNDTGVPGAAENDDLFGFAVFAADLDADGSDDLAVGGALPRCRAPPPASA